MTQETTPTASESPGANAVPTGRRSEGRRSGRGWGPFSGAQLTVIIVTFAVLLLFPIGAWAVSGSNVFVTDATSGQHAAVIGGTGALTVAAASPKNFFTRGIDPSGALTPIVKSPAGHALVITSVYLNVLRASVTGSGHWLSISVSKTNNTCSAIVSNELPDIEYNPAAAGPVTFPFQPGIVVPANRALCVINHDTTNIDAEVFAYGYVIPAAGAPAGASLKVGSDAPSVDPNVKH